MTFYFKQKLHSKPVTSKLQQTELKFYNGKPLHQHSTSSFILVHKLYTIPLPLQTHFYYCSIFLKSPILFRNYTNQQKQTCWLTRRTKTPRFYRFSNHLYPRLSEIAIIYSRTMLVFQKSLNQNNLNSYQNLYFFVKVHVIFETMPEKSMFFLQFASQ